MLSVDFRDAQLRGLVARKSQTFMHLANGYIGRYGLDGLLFVDPKGEATSKVYWLLNLAYKEQALEHFPTKSNHSAEAD